MVEELEATALSAGGSAVVDANGASSWSAVAAGAGAADVDEGSGAGGGTAARPAEPTGGRAVGIRGAGLAEGSESLLGAGVEALRLGSAGCRAAAGAGNDDCGLGIAGGGAEERRGGIVIGRCPNGCAAAPGRALRGRVGAAGNCAASLAAASLSAALTSAADEAELAAGASGGAPAAPWLLLEAAIAGGAWAAAGAPAAAGAAAGAAALAAGAAAACDAAAALGAAAGAGAAAALGAAAGAAASGSAVAACVAGATATGGGAGEEADASG